MEFSRQNGDVWQLYMMNLTVRSQMIHRFLIKIYCHVFLGSSNVCWLSVPVVSVTSIKELHCHGPQRVIQILYVFQFSSSFKICASTLSDIDIPLAPKEQFHWTLVDLPAPVEVILHGNVNYMYIAFQVQKANKTFAFSSWQGSQNPLNGCQ